MSGNIKCTGVATTPGPDGSVPLRRELRELQANSPDQFNVFILGLRSLQGVKEDDLTSYYQIAGIHGMPFKAWNNVQSSSGWFAESGQFGGYCTHSSVLFIPWHRPYLALFEQSLYAACQKVAQAFPASIRDKYVQAAKTVRLPYFDWAMKPADGSYLPSALGTQTITVVDVDGVRKNIDNPLCQFNFHPVNPVPGDFVGGWEDWKNTVRYPDARRHISNNAMVASVLKNESASLRSETQMVLLQYKDFDAFSNNQSFHTSIGNFGSLEDLHNKIHDKTGGPNGHMRAVEVSAFDPIFWLHHCNVDRLWSIWQDLNPTSFIKPQPAPYQTFTTKRGEMESQDSKLRPFWDGSGTDFWKGSKVKDSTTFGYAYPETQKWKFSSTTSYQNDIRQKINQFYGGNIFSSFAETMAAAAPQKNLMAKPVAAALAVTSAPAAEKQKETVVAAEAPKAEVAADNVNQPQKPIAHLEATAKAGGSDVIPASLQHLAPQNKYKEWVVNVEAVKHALGQMYRVLVFLGDINPDHTTWDTEFNCVGRVTVLTPGSTIGCAKCHQDAAGGLKITGTVNLTSALLQDIVAGQLHSLEPDQVVPHLRDHLKCRVTLFDGSEKPLDQVPGLKIHVCSTEVTIGSDGQPHYSGQYTVHPEITAGLPGGVGTVN